MELEQLYKDIQPKLYAFFYVKTLRKEVAEDLTQEVFYQALKGSTTFLEHSTVKTWIFSIANNILKKYYRSKHYSNALSNKLQVEQPILLSIEEEVVRKEEEKWLINKINQLDDASKEVVIFRTYGELSFKEIGDLLDKTENYARVTFHRAKLKLQKELMRKNER